MSKNKTSIIIGCDHAAYALKEKVKAFIQAAGYPVEDVGTHGETSVDYPDFAVQVAGKVSSGQFKRGILICGTGIGVSMHFSTSQKLHRPVRPEQVSDLCKHRHIESNYHSIDGVEYRH